MHRLAEGEGQRPRPPVALTKLASRFPSLARRACIGVGPSIQARSPSKPAAHPCPLPIQARSPSKPAAQARVIRPAARLASNKT